MVLLQLKYFCALAKNQHLNQTAQEMCVTPSAISSSLARLEHELGVKLFDRIGRNIRLNENGRIFLKHTEQALLSLELAEKELKQHQLQDTRKISVVVTNPNLWNNSLQEFFATHPDIFVTLTAFETNISNKGGFNLPNSLVENADFYIATTGETINNNYKFESSLLFESDIFLAVSKMHRFANRVKIDLSEAKNEWFVNSPAHTSFRTFCDKLCMEAGFLPKSRIECDYMLRPRMLVSENMVCLATSTGQRSGLYDGVHMIPICSPPCSRPQSIYWRSNKPLCTSANIFKDFMIEYYRRSG